MGSMNEHAGGTTGVRVTSDDHHLAQELEVDHKPPSTVLSDGLKKWQKLEELRDEKKQELKNRMEKLRQEASKWNIEMGNIY